jgi:hypothetical protein
VLTAFFQRGWSTRALGLGALAPVEGYLPGLVLAILFGFTSRHPGPPDIAG